MQGVLQCTLIALCSSNAAAYIPIRYSCSCICNYIRYLYWIRYTMSIKHIKYYYLFHATMFKDNVSNITWQKQSFLLLLLLLSSSSKPAAHAKWEKQNYSWTIATPQAPPPWKTEENTNQWNNQWLTAPLSPSSVPVQTQCREGHFTFETRPFKLQWMSRGNSLNKSNSCRSRWKLAKQ